MCLSDEQCSIAALHRDGIRSTRDRSIRIVLRTKRNAADTPDVNEHHVCPGHHADLMHPRFGVFRAEP